MRCLLPSGVSVHAVCVCVCVCVYLSASVVTLTVCVLTLAGFGFIFPTKRQEGVLYKLLLSKENRRAEKNMRCCKSKEAAEFMEPSKELIFIVVISGRGIF